MLEKLMVTIRYQGIHIMQHNSIINRKNNSKNCSKNKSRKLIMMI